MNNLDKQYTALLQDILDNGVTKQDRTGTGTLSVFGRQMRFNLKEGFPVCTTKEIHLKSVFHELIWFLKGSRNIKYLVDNNVRIWNEWPFEKYKKYCLVNFLPEPTMKEFIEKIKTDNLFAEVFGDIGPVYGYQWINYKGVTDKGDIISINQIEKVINDLKNNPDSRRIKVNAWNVTQIDDMTLPCCHYDFQFWTRELDIPERIFYAEHNNIPTKPYHTDLSSDKELNLKNEKEYNEYLDSLNIPAREVSLMFNMRSVDCGLGMPFDIASYGALLHMIAATVNMLPAELIINTGDTHI